MHYQFLPEADEDIANILRYTIKRWGITQARKYERLLFDAFTSLAENPLKIGSRDVSYLHEDYRRYPIGKHYIYYKCIDEGIIIIRILHERMNQEAYF